MGIYQWPFQDPIDWRYLPYIRPLFKAYVSEYPHKIWPEIWYSTSICWILEFPLIVGFHGNSMENPTPRSTKQHLSMVPNISGWWLTYPSEKSWISSVGMMTFPIYIYIYGKIKNVPDHQPDMIWSSSNLWLILGVFNMNGARDCSTIVPQIILSIHHKSDKSVAKSRNLQFKLEVPSH